MALDTNILLANALLDRFDTEFPAGSILEIRTGASPGAENAATGTLLSTITTPASPWAAAAAGSKAKNGTWQDASAPGAGTAAHYRLKNAADTRRIDGTVTATSGGGDLELDNVVIAVAQVVTITGFTYSLV